MKLDNIVASFVIMAMLIGLSVVIYNGLQTTYGFNEGFTDDDGDSIMDKLNDLNLIGGIEQSVNAIYSITNPSNPIDIIGGLLSAGIGAIRVITGVVSLPIEILLIITNFYTNLIPPIVSQGVGLLFSIYMGFILLSYYTRSR